MTRFAGVLDALGRAAKGAQDAYGESREDRRLAFRRAREDQGKDPDATRMSTMLGTNRTITALREMLGMGNPEQIKVYNQMGMGLSDDRATRVGQLLGHVGADLTQDTTRSLYWLLNAPQAVGNVITEGAVAKSNPDLFTKLDYKFDDAGNPITASNTKEAIAKGFMDAESGRLKKGYSYIDKDGVEKQIAERVYKPGAVESLMIPSGLAINTSIGLMNPFGGAEGYKAALPDEEDPTKTSNVVGEIASKYILGKTGNLLPWEEFKKVRPDVSKDEYMRYKAFKFDKEQDYNPLDDGKMTTLGGVLKYTNEGIHGPEVQFLGRSLPVATGILPTAAAIAGTALGVRNKRRPIETGFAGGMAGAVGGMAAGMGIEEERRRRNALENQIDTID